MQLKKMDKKYLFVSIINSLLSIIFLLGPLFIVSILVIDVMVLNVIFAIYIVILLIFLMIYPFLYYNNYKYAYNEERVYIRYGVIFSHQVVVPIANLQDIHIYKGPVMQLFKMSSVIVSTAGSNFTVKGMSNIDALDMLEFLEKIMNKEILGE